MSNTLTDAEIVEPRASYDVISNVSEPETTKRAYSKWTEIDRKLLKELIESGKSVTYCSHHFNKSENNIRTTLSGMGLKVKDSKTGKYSRILKEDISTRIRILKGEEIRRRGILCLPDRGWHTRNPRRILPRFDH